jgi:hypothetical protein
MANETLPTNIEIDGRIYEVETWFKFMGEARCAIVEVGALDKPINDRIPVPGVPNTIRGTVHAKALYLATVGVEFNENRAHVGYFEIDNGPRMNHFGTLAVHALASALELPIKETFEPRKKYAEPLERIGVVSAFPVVSHLDYLGDDYDEL